MLTELNEISKFILSLGFLPDKSKSNSIVNYFNYNTIFGNYIIVIATEVSIKYATFEPSVTIFHQDKNNKTLDEISWDITLKTDLDIIKNYIKNLNGIK